MNEAELRHALEEAQNAIRVLQEELAETNRGLVALTMELETRVEARTQELRETHAELEKVNRELLELTRELENRVDLRTKELHEKTEELRTMSQQLWHAAKLATMGELAASVAHELNNPLATINLHLESLQEETLPDSAGARRLGIIVQEVDRMANLVANLLQFSRPGHHQLSTIDVRKELDQTLEIIYYVFRKNRVRVEREYAPDAPAIHADRQKLRQVFLNLLMNACDAMPRGGIITLRTLPTELDGKPAVQIEVADTGTGIAPDDLARVTEPFFTTKGEGKGTGLGLAICRRIVQEHEGTLALTSKLKKGTTVRVVLPVANFGTGESAGE